MRGRPALRVLQSLDLTLHEGDLIAITGRSGSGKSTLLHVLGLLDPPTSGRYELRGIETSTMSERERSHIRGRQIGLVFQSYHLLDNRSVVDNIALALLHRRMSRRERLRRAHVALDEVGMSHRASFAPQLLSGGERQRIAIARAIVGRPSLLLADEPTGNLDGDTAATILELFRQLNQHGQTTVIVTHDPSVADATDRRLVLADGRLTPAP